MPSTYNKSTKHRTVVARRRPTQPTTIRIKSSKPSSRHSIEQQQHNIYRIILNNIHDDYALYVLMYSVLYAEYALGALKLWRGSDEEQKSWSSSQPAASIVVTLELRSMVSCGALEEDAWKRARASCGLWLATTSSGWYWVRYWIYSASRYSTVVMHFNDRDDARALQLRRV